MPFVTANGLRLFYQTEGQGPPVLFISGLGVDHRGWWKQVPALRNSFTCIVFDNRDVGQSAEASALYTIAEMAQDAGALLEALNIPSAHVVGFSMGGAIAMELAIGHPEKVRSLCLLSSYHQGDPRGTDLMRAFALMKERFSPEEYYRAVYPWIFTYDDYLVPGQMESYLRQALETATPQSLAAFARQARATASFDAEGRLERIVAPTLIVTGTGDILTPLRFAEALHQGIRSSQLLLVPGAGHAMLWTHDRPVNAALLGFLSSVG